MATFWVAIAVSSWDIAGVAACINYAFAVVTIRITSAVLVLTAFWVAPIVIA